METKILAPERKNIELCAAALRNGELVAFPTETVYGLGGNALDSRAAEKIYAAKGRPSDNPLIVHVPSLEAVKNIVAFIPDAAYKLAEKFMPGPLTVVLEKKPVIPDNVTGGLNTVAVRIPRSRVALELLKQAEVPVCAPSANTSGKPSPTTARHVKDDLDGKIPYILDGGSCSIGIESTVVDLTGKLPRILRPGGLSTEEIRNAVGTLDTETVKSDRPLCPGMKYKHYAPKAEVLFSAYYDGMYENISKWYDDVKNRGGNPVIMCLSGSAEKYGSRNVMRMGLKYEDYAHNLFAAMRLADEKGYTVILAEGVEDKGIGASLINRLIKSSGGRII